MSRSYEKSKYGLRQFFIMEKFTFVHTLNMETATYLNAKYDNFV